MRIGGQEQGRGMKRWVGYRTHMHAGPVRSTSLACKHAYASVYLVMLFVRCWGRSLNVAERSKFEVRIKVGAGGLEKRLAHGVPKLAGAQWHRGLVGGKTSECRC